jgi:Synaptobrevin
MACECSRTVCIYSTDARSVSFCSNFAFLQQIQTEFAKQNRWRRVSTANAYAFDKGFAPNFRSTIHYYNSNHSKLRQDDKVRALMTKVEDMKAVMGRNIELSLLRAAKLEDMIEKSEDLQGQTQVFYKRAKVVKKQRIRKLYRVYFTLAAVIVGVVYLMMVPLCGWLLQCGRHW